jgi:hypothetical protein
VVYFFFLCRKIGDDILDEYRYDSKKLQQLQQRLRARLGENKRNREQLRSRSPRLDMEASQELKRDKLQHVKERHEAILQADEEKRIALNHEIHKNLNKKQKKSKEVASNPLIQKQRLWIRIIHVVQIVREFYAKVFVIREMRQKNEAL